MSFNRNIRWKFLFIAILILSACEKEAILHDIDSELPKLIENNSLPSLAACVVKDDSIMWSRNYGFSNQENATRVDEGTIYHIGSISKLFIVTAIMQLEEAGDINLDEDISNFLPIVFRHPDFPDIPITARMLLTHVAGLSWPGSYDGEQGMWNRFPLDGGPPPWEWIPQFLIPSGEHYDANLWKPISPGSYEFYSNIGACVAAYIVEIVSGQNFREYCRNQIFGPLNMQNTSYFYGDLEGAKIALMYSKHNVRSFYFENRVYVAGGVKTSVRDLSLYARCILNKGVLNGQRILSESSVDSMLEIQNPASGRCLIWKAYPDGWFGHTGGLVLGTSTSLVIHPDTKRGIIIFTNTHSGAVTPGGEVFSIVKQKANEYAE